jgi:NAD-dependent deacetylase
MSLDTEQQSNVDAVVALLRDAESILFITGAGISADSGLPTYRGVGGIYEDEDLTEDGVPIEAALSGQMIETRPEISWKHIARIEQGCREAGFNRGHEVITEMERHFPRVWTLTQNVDGFHRNAGTKNLIDIHGDYHDLRCSRCGYRTEVAAYRDLPKIPPDCPDCGHHLRPDVVFFGEMLPEEKYTKLATQVRIGFDLVFSVGTTSVFPYIVMPVMNAFQTGVPTIEINPGQTEVSGIVNVKISAGAAETLDAIWTGYQRTE